ncbi:MAG: protein kinase, partial [Myxococcota bacterium]
VEDGGHVAMVMELVEGPTLRERLATVGAFPVDHAADLIRQLADGLAAVHEIGIIHRDLKPENILIDASEGVERLKIADFGLAMVPGAHRLTQHGAALGTPEYMAPERFSSRDPRPTDDVYAIGVLFYELIVGAPPFTGEDPMAVMAQIIRRDGADIGCADAGPFEDLITSCLACEPGHRPKDAGEVLQLLDARGAAPAASSDDDTEAVVVLGGLPVQELLELLPPFAEPGQILEGDVVSCIQAPEAAFRWLRRCAEEDPRIRGAMDAGSIVGSGVGIFAGAPVGRATRLARLARAGDILVGPGGRRAIGLGLRAGLELVGSVRLVGSRDTLVHRLRVASPHLSHPKEVGEDGMLTCECGARVPAPAEESAPVRVRCDNCGRVLTARVVCEPGSEKTGGELSPAKPDRPVDVLRLDVEEDKLLSDLTNS